MSTCLNRYNGSQGQARYSFRGIDLWHDYRHVE
ncbi:hypothetical protein AvCA_36770 [Azotobacter vinelandii CA]|uniref:Uncharacterized protein n=2 Tax=Azotobacter vinelandii TaxID=354 RepID=C1DRG6_AZOVD|nr:hypothetical protein Avin_36770 [Azotobacter vinelandii DJ]AGK14556.1 hypothetical protein AvCA_36770 [Azotobacter vinelandii CA]AGK21531.1 hypothetical protein AvCA6_36770 [Azotobacter vinelandii CA6]